MCSQLQAPNLRMHEYLSISATISVYICKLSMVAKWFPSAGTYTYMCTGIHTSAHICIHMGTCAHICIDMRRRAHHTQSLRNLPSNPRILPRSLPRNPRGFMGRFLGNIFASTQPRKVGLGPPGASRASPHVGACRALALRAQ